MLIYITYKCKASHGYDRTIYVVAPSLNDAQKYAEAKFKDEPEFKIKAFSITQEEIDVIEEAKIEKPLSEILEEAQP